MLTDNNNHNNYNKNYNNNYHHPITMNAAISSSSFDSIVLDAADEDLLKNFIDRARDAKEAKKKKSVSKPLQSTTNPQ